MTNTEERLYLETLLLESARWRITEDDVYSPIEREIMDRLRRLNGIDTEDENGYVQSNLPAEEEALTGSDYQALEAAKLNDHLSSKDNAKRKWASNRVRVVIDGKHTWKLKSDCHKEVMPGCKTKMHWVWNGPAGDEEPDVDKKKQVEAMWEEHERA